MTKKDNNLLYRIADFVFRLMFKVTSVHLFIMKIKMRISKWMCPHDNECHYIFDSCYRCENYCVDHDREDWDEECAVCEILKLNQNNFSIKALDNLLHRVQHGAIEIGETYYQENEYKYVA